MSLTTEIHIKIYVTPCFLYNAPISANKSHQQRSLMALEKRSDIPKEVTKTIDDVLECLQRLGKLIVAVQEFVELVLTAAKRALRVHREIRNEEIKRIYQVKRVLPDLELVAQKAFVFLDKVDDIVGYCGGDSMAAARKDLSFFVDLQLAEGFW